MTAIASFLLALASLLPALANPPAEGHLLFLDVEGQQVPVALPSAPRYVIDPRNGDFLLSFTPEEAMRVAEALEERGLQGRLLDVLLGLRHSRDGGPTPQPSPGARSVGPAPPSLTRGDYCLALVVQDKHYALTLHGGGPVYALDPLTGDRVMRFSIDDATRIAETLRADGRDTATLMQVLFGLRMSDVPATEEHDAGATAQGERRIKDMRMSPWTRHAASVRTATRASFQAPTSSTAARAAEAA
ncbi:MAG: hypothetical protein ACE5JH_12120 [Acidobacteriota bacterium]